MEKVSKCLRIALLQLKAGSNKIENVNKAINKIKSVVQESSPKIVALPECFNSPYGTKFFNEYAETIPDGYTSTELSKVAKELGIYLIGGSIPERDSTDSKILYNTSTVWSPTGSLIAKHRKMHLFDIDIPGGIRFKESEVLSPGNTFTTFNVDDVKIGLGICYDIRFEEMARIYRNKGCRILIYPAAFNMTTGPLHWEILQKGRALDTQCYVVTISPARDESAGYVAYGHSMIVDPWAKIVASAKENEETIIANLDMAVCDQVRAQIPIFNQRRTDLYDTLEKN